ncbi:DUF2971 domain-containing protein [Pedobacter panaciterrae]|uniref:DUF2971 domain-containing protein n=1 Tax=Pedobacter panaciterrae TaxID=363849 RepID=UPI00155D8732|nr:DUF2971 domain-containing protein [Pedobacter panaciterrae]NQX56680.1 DUF2971 domain-containing protein [Pedobacter panaciterrae]
MNTPPLTLYKYIRWSDKPRDKIKDILFKNRFYFADPTTFNDPFDSKIPIIFEDKYRASEQFHLDFLRIDNLLGKTNYTEDEMKRKAKEYHLNPGRIIYDTDKMTQSIHESISNQIRISCFSTKRDHILMWSHYADCHQGICIGFRTLYLLLDPKLVMLNKVNYARQFPKFDKVTSLPIITTKSALWKYENEYRLINIDCHPLIEFPKATIQEVIIGYRMKDDIKTKLLDYLKKHYPAIKVSFSRPNPLKFKMDIVPITKI